MPLDQRPCSRPRTAFRRAGVGVVLIPTNILVKQSTVNGPGLSVVRNGSQILIITNKLIRSAIERKPDVEKTFYCFINLL